MGKRGGARPPLSDERVATIKAYLSTNPHASNSGAARYFSVSDTTISSIRRGTYRGGRAGTIETPVEQAVESPPMNGSMKDRVLRLVVENGPFPNARALIAALRVPDETSNYDLHDVTHIIKDSLGRAGLVSFRHGSTNQNIPLDIIATKRGIDMVRGAQVVNGPIARSFQMQGSISKASAPVNGSSADNGALAGSVPVTIEESVMVTAERAVETGGIEAPGTPWPAEPVEPAKPRLSLADLLLGDAEASVALDHDEEQGTQSGPFGPPFEDEAVASALLDDAEKTEGAYTAKPPVATYPQLDRLRARQAERLANGSKQTAYLEAAAILDSIDPGESGRLLALAERVMGEPLSPVEAEYLRWVADHDVLLDEFVRDPYAEIPNA